jgi:CubicO group peptidase (beta-lactamase class C family)
MRVARGISVVVAAGAVLLAAAQPAVAAKRCAEPGAEWERASPAEAGMDAARLQDAIDYGSTQASYAIRVFRHGCLVGEDRLADVNRDERYESWSMAKSVTALIFGRAMTMRLISPEDPVGSLVPEADEPHGAITARDLLTMTSGLRWNGFRDYNIFTMQDRVHDALTLEVVHPPGTYFEYAQSAVALLAETAGRAAGQDFQAFGQRELMDPLGISAGDWAWTRDPAGHVQGFYGVHMTADDFGRLGELLRRGGVWRGRRLLARRFVREAVAPSPTNGCYGYLIWVNAGAPCIGPTISERPVAPTRDFPEFPADMYSFSGLFGQRVTVFPSLGLMVVRTGQDPSLIPATGANWEDELYRRVLGSVTDQEVERPGDGPPARGEESADYGFQTALLEPEEYSKSNNPDPLPPAGPARARAAQLGLARRRAGRRGQIVLRLWCPPRWPSPMAAGCRGSASAKGTRRARRYSVAPGRAKVIRLKLKRRRLRALRRRGTLTVEVVARNADAAAGTTTRLEATVRRPKRRR